MNVKTAAKASIRSFGFSMFFISLFPISLTGQTGSASNPFTQLGQAQSITTEGVYYFNLTGTTFSTYVRSGGWVQVAIDFGGGMGSLPQSTGLTNTARGILNTTALGKLTSATKARIIVSTGAVDVTSSNATHITRITTNTALSRGNADNALSDSWTGTGATYLTANAGNCTANTNNGLHERVIHIACNFNGMHWIPVDNSQQIANNQGNIASNHYLQLLVQAPAVAVVLGPTFNTQPSSNTQNLCLSSPATSLTTSATGPGTISYQWYRNTTASTSGGTVISGATGTSYTPPTTSSGTNYYYVIATNSQGSTTSSLSGAIIVSTPSVGGTASSNQTICAGATPAALSLTGQTGSIQWQVSSNNSTFTNISGATSATLSTAQIGALNATQYYRAVIINGGCSGANSTVVTITVTPLPTIQSTQPSAICGTGTATIGASVNSGTVNWFTASTGGTSVGTGTTFTTPSLSSTTTYFTSVTENGCTSTPRTAVIVTVNAVPANATATLGQVSTEVLVVGGGGSGGFRHGGGGGAGGVVYQNNFGVSPGTYTVTVGAGGSGNSGNGGNSTFSSLTAFGGGGGGDNGQVGKNGGSGGGGSNGSFGGNGTAGQGNKGGDQNNGAGCCNPYGAGGGGAAAAGANTTASAASAGGAGLPFSISGASVYYGGGGGGGTYTTTSMLGGPGGGGAGGRSNSLNGTAGAPNTGGGGGGGGANGSNSGNGGPGGSGVVIIKYAGSPIATGGVITQVGGNTIHTFNSSGTFVLNGSTTANVPNVSSCNPSSLTFNGTVSSGLTLDWYNTSTGGNLLSSGTTYTTPVLSTSTTYFVSVRNTSTGCVSNARTAVNATINGGSTISANQSVCIGNEPAAVVLSNYTGSISWQQSTDNISFSSITGQTSPSLSGSVLGNVSNAVYIRAAIVNGSCNAFSSVHSILPTTLSVNSSIVAEDYVWNGKQSSIWINAGNWLKHNGTSLVEAQTPPTTSTTIIIPSAQTCVLNQPSLGSNTVFVKNIIIEPSSTLSLNSGTLSITGNLTNNGSLNTGTGTVEFSGTTTQLIDGSNITEFYNLTLNNNHTGVYPSHVAVKLLQDATVTNTLTLTDGILDVFNNVLTLGTPTTKATITPALGSADSYVAAHHNTTPAHVGFVKQFVHGAHVGNNTFYNFPIGDDGKWTPFNLKFDTGTSIASGAFISTHVNDALVSNASNSNFVSRIVRDWEVEPSPGITTPNYTIEIFHNQSLTETNGLASSGSVPFKKTSGTGQLNAPTNALGINSSAIVEVGTYSSTLNSFTWTGLTSFSNFGGTDVNQALPIELVSFQANCKEDNSVSVTWTTASEHNTSHYIVEKSRDGSNWSVLSQTAAAGSSAQILNYEMVDSEKAIGTTYYRLTQFDNDGVFEVFNPVSVNCNGTISNNHITTYPNPSLDGFYVSLFTKTMEGNGQLTITDASGRPICEKSVTIQDGNNVFHIGDFNAAPGLYYIEISNGTSTTDRVKHSVH